MVADFLTHKPKAKAKHKRAKEKGYVEFFNVPVGETQMIVKHQIPRTIETKYSTRKVFRIIVDGKEYDFAVNEMSPLDRYLIIALLMLKAMPT